MVGDSRKEHRMKIFLPFLHSFAFFRLLDDELLSLYLVLLADVDHDLLKERFEFRIVQFEIVYIFRQQIFLMDRIQVVCTRTVVVVIVIVRFDVGHGSGVDLAEDVRVRRHDVHGMRFRR